MNFPIFRDFSRFFWNFPNLFLIFKEFKTIKKRAKRGLIFARVPRGCDVARKATWQSHAGPRESLCDAEVTRRRIFIFIIYSVL